MLVETQRLTLTPFTLDDAPFMLALMNEPSYIRGIADRGVRTLSQAKAQIEERILSSYQEYDFGMYKVSLKQTNTPIGVAGLVKRPQLDEPDLGYAFLEEFHGQGYACEAADAVLKYELPRLGIKHVDAIVNADNLASIGVLTRLGFQYCDEILLEPNVLVSRYRLGK